MADVTVVRQPSTGAWSWACTTHGVSVFQWWGYHDAAYDAIGHAAAHHPPTAGSE